MGIIHVVRVFRDRPMTFINIVILIVLSATFDNISIRSLEDD